VRERERGCIKIRSSALAAIWDSDVIFLARGAINQIKAIARPNDVMGDIPDFRMIF